VWTLRSVLAAGLVLAASAVGCAPAADDIFPYQVHQTTLANGLEVVAIPYDSPGTVAYYTVVRTGARHEVEPGHSGFAHFFEHMMFRGTETYPPDEYNAIIKRMGAYSSGNTTDDRTVYEIVGPAVEFETMMKIESDRFKNLEYEEDAFRTEALAVLGEYNKNFSNPFLPLYERMRDLAFQKHTYKHTTMGFLEDIRAMPDYYEYSLAFFDRFYRPENTVLLFVGDVEPQPAFRMAKKYYGDWERGYREPTIESEPPQAEALKDHIDWPNPIHPQIMMGYHVPAFSAETVDIATIDVISQLLFSESAPLFQQLVIDEQWVDFVQGWYPDHRDPYLFTIYMQVKSEELIPKIEEAMAEHIGKLQQEPIDEKRLERIKSYLRYRYALTLDSPQVIADSMGHYLNLTGEPETLRKIYAQYEKVTVGDVQRVAEMVFQPQTRTVVTLSHPSPKEEPTTQGGA
jgi:zinc protease